MMMHQHPNLWDFLAAAPIYVLTLLLIPWALMRTKDPTAALAWCVAILFLPIVGSLLFLIFGKPHIVRPLRRKRRHHEHFARRRGQQPYGVQPATGSVSQERGGLEGIRTLGERLGLDPITEENSVRIYD